MIEIKGLTQEDIGQWVEYTPAVGKKQKGRIKSWNEEYIFVVYHCNHEWDRYQEYTGQPTNPSDLKYTGKPFDYYEAPSQEVFDDIKEKAMELWKIVDTNNDKYGYATEKINRIKDLENVQDNAWMMVAMFDQNNIVKLLDMVKNPTEIAIRNMLIHQFDDQI